ncbi:unnamed protein product [Acanthoscelides obtectus]|uniref:Uncharacterized protein n=1 Tax=Acanthoscelides obtectus TaxID=200917 RepID=A0A9P0KLS7_ACAOB|nr:unnamed protein product [Acanthoscelides obtectus]CAK1675096.1 hypothetical protein AOBTE_LOCUS29899 [Acanthoscelides obtectus]
MGLKCTLGLLPTLPRETGYMCAN